MWRNEEKTGLKKLLIFTYHLKNKIEKDIFARNGEKCLKRIFCRVVSEYSKKF